MIYAGGGVSDPNSGRQLGWAELVNIAHRNFHLLPEGMEPGLEATHVMQVPTGDKLPKDGRVQMYPCHSFEFHVVLMAIDPVLGKPEIRRYVIGHDCGTVINPHIVKGMTLGGIAHGLGAALLEEFVYDDEGHLITQSFMDYLLPSSHEVPEVEIVHHCTPSPHTVFGQKGSGESGYLGAPAAISARGQRLRRAARHFLQQASDPDFRHRRRRSRTHNRANPHGSKRHDHRLPRPSGAAEPAGRHPRARPQAFRRSG